MVLESLKRRPAVPDILQGDSELPAAGWHVQWVGVRGEESKIKVMRVGDDC